MSSARSPIDISFPEPAFITRPATVSSGASAAAMNARAVSVASVRSRVGVSAPSATCSLPAASWVMMVGITARVDWRGPYVLNGRTVTTGTPNAA